MNTGGICCATTTGTRESDGDAAPRRLVSACGPPVELPMAMMRGGTSEKGRCLKASLARASAQSGIICDNAGAVAQSRALRAHPAERLDLADHLAAEIERGGDLAI